MIKQLLPFITSMNTLMVMYLLGRKDKRGWMLSMFNQFLWMGVNISFGVWGLVPFTMIMLYISTSNLIRWTREENTNGS